MQCKTSYLPCETSYLQLETSYLHVKRVACNVVTVTRHSRSPLNTHPIHTVTTQYAFKSRQVRRDTICSDMLPHAIFPGPDSSPMTVCRLGGTIRRRISQPWERGMGGRTGNWPLNWHQIGRRRPAKLPQEMQPLDNPKIPQHTTKYFQNTPPNP